ncbi:hypothetical protein ACIP88_35135 [Streptomyces uncialis]|uniref:hypothetical protein n=1 Tax=Streptomyces uncialis TaxID=1048205 RepID=UPI0037FC669F
MDLEVQRGNGFLRSVVEALQDLAEGVPEPAVGHPDAQRLAEHLALIAVQFDPDRAGLPDQDRPGVRDRISSYKA